MATIRHLLSSISPNGIHPPGSGTTPLHLAASRGRVDVVKLLLEQENIDDSLRDSQGKTCRDVADAEEVIHAIDGIYLCHVIFLKYLTKNQFRVPLISQCRLQIPPQRLYSLSCLLFSIPQSRSAPGISQSRFCGPLISPQQFRSFSLV